MCSVYVAFNCLTLRPKYVSGWLATHLSPRALTSFASLRKSKICGLASSIKFLGPSVKRPESRARAARGRPLARQRLASFQDKF